MTLNDLVNDVSERKTAKRPLLTDVKREEGRRRLQELNRRLEETKLKAARLRRPVSSVGELDALALLEQELLADEKTVDADQPLPQPALFRQETRARVVEQQKITFALHARQVTLPIDKTMSVGGMKRQAHAALVELGNVAGLKASASDYILFASDFFQDESILMQDAPYVVLCRTKGVRPQIDLVSRTVYKLFVQQVQALCGFDQSAVETRVGEPAHFRIQAARQHMIEQYRAQEALNEFGDCVAADEALDKADARVARLCAITMPSHVPPTIHVKVHLNATLIKTLRYEASTPVRQVLQDAVKAGVKLGAADTRMSRKGGNLPTHVLKMRGSHRFLFHMSQPLALNPYVSQELRQSQVNEIALVLIDLARCKPSLLAQIERQVVALRFRRARNVLDRQLDGDQQLEREAGDAALWREAAAAAAARNAADPVAAAKVLEAAEHDACVDSVAKKLRVRILSLDEIDTAAAGLKKLVRDKSKLWISMRLFCSGVELHKEVRTDTTLLNSECQFGREWLEALPYNELPCATIVHLSAIAHYRKKDAQVCVGWANVPLFGYDNRIRQGSHRVLLHTDGAPDPFAPTTPIAAADVNDDVAVHPPLLVFEIEIMTRPLALKAGFEHAAVALPRREVHVPLQSVRERVEDIVERHSMLREMPETDRALIWSQRAFCRTLSSSIGPLLRAVPWTNCESVREAYRILREWDAPLDAVDALLVFGSHCVDKVVRAFGTRQLDRLGDDELANYLLQLVAALKHEPHHWSPLAAFLLRRGLADKRGLGHRLFWLLRAEVHGETHHRERFGLMMEAFLRGCSREEREELVHEHELNERLRDCAGAVQDCGKRADRPKALSTALEQLNLKLHTSVALPLDAGARIKAVCVDKCRSLDSKTMPLWLVMENEDECGDDILTLFKAGDDLRQDQLTLQMMYLMDLMWLEAGLDLRTVNYGVIATGPEFGFVQVVLRCATTADIQLEFGKGIKAAFSEKPLDKWLRKHNPTDDMHARAVDNLVRSCAASCVATYVLGIGDRHNDNVMVTRDGRLFHIDFGRFLGNAQMFGSFKRDRAPFVLTPEFVYAMGGRDSANYRQFCDLACRAFNVVRANAHVLLSLFSMMVSTGIPELQSLDDLGYVDKALATDKTPDEATTLFQSLIDESLSAKFTRANNAIHLLARPD